MPFDNSVQLPPVISQTQAEKVSLSLSKAGFIYDPVQIKFYYSQGTLEAQRDLDFGAIPGQNERFRQAVEAAPSKIPEAMTLHDAPGGSPAAGRKP